jgi:hypothetical protein
MNNPMTTAEDIVKAGASGVPARLAVGSNGHVLTVTAGAVGWAAPAGGSGGVEVVLKTADETVNNSATLQNDDELKFAVGASEKWQFDCDIYHTTGGTVDLKSTWVGPSGSTIIWSVLGKDAANAVLDTTAALAGATTTSMAGSTGVMFHQRHMGVISNGATPGDLQFQWAQNTQTASNSIVHALSNIRLVQLA